MAEDDIGQAARLDLLRHDAASPVGRPVAFAGDILQFVVAVHSIGESLVTLLRRRGAHGARDLEYERLATWSGHLAGYGERIKADDTACLHIITADESRIIVGFRLSVEEDHGNAFRPDLGDSRRDGSRLIGRHHEQVDVLIGEAVNLAYLQLGIIIGIGDAHLYIVLVEVLRGQHLIVHLIAPLPFRALRHANFIRFCCVGAGCEQEQAHSRYHQGTDV